LPTPGPSLGNELSTPARHAEPTDTEIDKPSQLSQLETAASAVESLWRSVLSAIRKSQPLVLLSSISLVIAAFVQNVSEEAVSYAVSASVAFLVALGFAILLEVRRKRSTMVVEYAAAALASTFIGFGMLAFVAFEMGARYPLARRTLAITVGSLTLFTFAVGEVSIWESAREFEKSLPTGSALRRSVRFLRLASLVGFSGSSLGWGGWIFFGIQSLESVTLVLMSLQVVIIILVTRPWRPWPKQTPPAKGSL